MESLRTFVNRSLLTLLGFMAMATQVILIREALAVFSGNELIIGMFLGIWMGLMAVGSFTASRVIKVTGHGSQVAGLLFILLSILPIFSLFLMVCLRFSLVPAGIMPGLGQTVTVIILALLPFCLVSGMLFPILVQSLSALRGKNLLHEGYALDSVGSIIGGLIFSLIFILAILPYESLVLLSSFSLVLISLVSVISRRYIRAIIIFAIAVFVFFLPAIPELAKIIDQKQFNKQEVIEIRSSPFGMITVCKVNDQVFIYENGLPVSLGNDVIQREESVHYAMLLHPLPEKVLMISGAASGNIAEVLKYTRSHLDYVDRDPWLLRVIDKYMRLPQDQRLNYHYQDARIYLKKTDKKYDVILVNISEPESIEMNRYYTVEFYQLIKERLKPGGIISVSARAAGNYMNETSRQVHSVIFNTIKTVFSHVRIIPGAKDYFLASDSTIEQSIFSNYEIRGINNDYVNPYYINETLLKMRSGLIVNEILPGSEINTDLKPYVFSLFLKQWMARLKANTWLIPLILILLLILSLFALGPLNLGLFAGGFTASGLEFILLIWFQVIYGYVYQMTGVIFAVFMGGLVLGSWLTGSRLKKKTFTGFLMIQGGFAIFSALIAALLLFSSSPLPPIIIFLLVFTTGSLMGLQFSLSAHLRKTSIITSSGESFSADLLGSAVGIILISVFVIPLIGLPMTALALAGLNVLVLGVMAWKSR